MLSTSWTPVGESNPGFSPVEEVIGEARRSLIWERAEDYCLGETTPVVSFISLMVSL